MKKSQLIAISRSYVDAKKKADVKRARELGIDMMYSYQTVYKTLGGYVRAYGTSRFKKAAQEAKNMLEKRKNMLEKCGCTSRKVDECQQALTQAIEYLMTF